MTVRLGARVLWGAALAWSMLGCSRSQGPDPKSSLAIVPSRLDLAAMTIRQRRTATVHLRNPSAVAVRIQSTASSARCQWQDLPSSLAAGAAIALSVTCQSDLIGPLHEQLRLVDATRSEPLATLAIVARIEPLVGFDTDFVDLRPAFGTEQSQEVRFIGERANQVIPTIRSEGGKVVRVALLAEAAGRLPGVRITCKGDTVGMHAGSLVLNTGIPEEPTLTLSWGCRVDATLVVEPSNPYFNLKLSGDPIETIVVRSSHPVFRVSSARIVDGPFRATVGKPNPDGSVPIAIRVNRRAIPDEARAASGTLVILSNDPREPRKEVPLFGFGRINKRDAN